MTPRSIVKCWRFLILTLISIGHFSKFLELKFGGSGNICLLSKIYDLRPKKCFTSLICVCFLKCRWTKRQIDMNTILQIFEMYTWKFVCLYQQWIGNFLWSFLQFIYVEIWVITNPYSRWCCSSWSKKSRKGI